MSRRTYYQMTASAGRAKAPETWQPDGRVRTEMSEGGVPRLPHEVDESADSQRRAPTEEIKQARRDLESGKVDTDRGAAVNATYKRIKAARLH